VAKQAEENEPAAEEETVEDADRQASEGAEEPIKAPETTEPETETPEKEVKTPVEGEGELSEADLEAKMSPKQREAFQNQRREIKRLKREKEAQERGKSALDALQPPAFGSIRPQAPRVEQFMDVDGQIDLVGYQNAAQKYNESQAYRAQAGQSQIKFEMEQNILKMRHPEIDPSSDQFDSDLEARVADRYGRKLLESLTKGQSEPSLVEIAGEVLKSKGVTPKEKEKISQEALEKVAEKEQAASTAEAPSGAVRAQGAKMVSGFDELRQRTKLGDDDALAARISAAEETARDRR